MAFDALLGNEQLKSNLQNSLQRGHVSHFYLIDGPVGAGKHTLARLLAAALMCTGETTPCLHCTACRKVMAGTHPDFITIDDPERKTVPVELIRQARADIYIRPNEGRRKIYLFPRGQDIGIPGQNALLKVLEEPPTYGVFILLTDTPEKLLPTVRSRCTQLHLQPLPDALMRQALTQSYPLLSPETIQSVITRSGGYLGQAQQLLNQDDTPAHVAELAAALAERNSLKLLALLVPMEKWKRDSLLSALTQWLELVQTALAARSGLSALSPATQQLSIHRSSSELMEMTVCLKKAIEYAQSNVSPAAICGYLEWALRG